MVKIVETKGECRNCGKEDLLADGLCCACWDKGKEPR